MSRRLMGPRGPIQIERYVIDANKDVRTVAHEVLELRHQHFEVEFEAQKGVDLHDWIERIESAIGQMAQEVVAANRTRTQQEMLELGMNEDQYAAHLLR